MTKSIPKTLMSGFDLSVVLPKLAAVLLLGSPT
jgi:hypothetical protein